MSSGTQFGKILEGKGSVTVQSVTLVAILAIGILGGRYAERAESILSGILTSITTLEATTKANSEKVGQGESERAVLKARVDTADARDEAQSSRTDALELRLGKLEQCARAGKRKCKVEG